MDNDPLASAAVEPVRSGMIVGLGTGRAAARAIRALARRARAERLDFSCIATSESSARLAESLGLRVLPPDGTARIDYLFDGADEVDRRLRMIKGRGGAMTREKILARAAERCSYLVQRAKCVDRLGKSVPLPIEVMRFGFTATVRHLSDLGLRGPVRRGDGGADYITDNGNPVIDAALPAEVELEDLRIRLDELPGVVGHGLFLTEAHEVIVEEEEQGVISRLTRASCT